MSTDVQTSTGRFVWHEHNSTDQESAKRFYQELLGWDFEDAQMPGMTYPMIRSGDQTHGGFGTAQGGAPSHWLGYVGVDDVDATADQIRQAGGNVMVGPMDIPEVGRFAVVADPQGAVFAIFASNEPGPLAQGVFVWDELLTDDVEDAKRFYGEVFGWTAEDMPMGGDFAYTIFKKPGEEMGVAGCTTKPDELKDAPFWFTYVGTGDVDATFARATELGAKAEVDPMDIPGNIGRFAVVSDPTGAAVGLFQPAEM